MTHSDIVAVADTVAVGVRLAKVLIYEFPYYRYDKK